MDKEVVMHILDRTHPEWRNTNPFSFETYAEYTEYVRKLFVDGMDVLGIEFEEPRIQ